MSYKDATKLDIRATLFNDEYHTLLYLILLLITFVKRG